MAHTVSLLMSIKTFGNYIYTRENLNLIKFCVARVSGLHTGINTLCTFTRFVDYFTFQRKKQNAVKSLT